MTCPLPEKKQIDCSLFYNIGFYAVTISPDDAHQYVGKEDRMKLFRQYWYEMFLCYKYKYNIDYHFELELSEPRNIKTPSYNGPRLHLHGIICFNKNSSIKGFLLEQYYKITKSALLDIDTLDNIDVWYNYCTKQNHIMKEPPLSNHEDLWQKLKNKFP